MTLYAADEDGTCICVDYIHGACITGGRWCEAEHCRCECRNRLIADDTDSDRARQLDDREPDKLTVIANEMETERHGDVPGRYSVDELIDERFGRSTRRAA